MCEKEKRIAQLEKRLAEAQALLDRVVDHVNFWHDHPYAECLHGVVRDYQALSASAEPSAPVEIDKPVCKGAWQLGTACGKCRRCKENPPT